MSSSVRVRGLALSAGLLGALLVGEAAVRLAVRAMGRSPFLRSDAILGWDLRPDLRGEIRVENGGHYRFSTNARASRLTRPFAAMLPPSAPTAVLAGDSFVFGQGVDDTETFAWRLGASTGRRVVNLGVPGYGPGQQLLRLQRYLAENPATPVTDIVVLAFENDLTEVLQDFQPYLGMSKPRFELRQSRLEPRSYEPSLADKLMNHSVLFSLVRTQLAWHAREAPPDPAEGVELVSECLAAICRLAAERGARCHLFAYRQIEGLRSEPAVWRKFLAGSGAEDVTDRIHTPAIPSPIGYDGLHWSPEGHFRMAAILADRLAAPSAAIVPRAGR
jgi:hypothetical protein